MRPHLVGAYQRALLKCPLDSGNHPCLWCSAECMWISREELLTGFGECGVSPVLGKSCDSSTGKTTVLELDSKPFVGHSRQ